MIRELLCTAESEAKNKGEAAPIGPERRCYEGLSEFRQWQIINVDSLALIPVELARSSLPPSSKQYTFIQADIRNSSELSSIFSTHRPDAVMHLAAETHVDHSIRRPRKFIETNIIGTFNLLEAALEYWRSCGKPQSFRFHHVSTDEVFGRLGETGRFTENSCYDPCNPYSATKAASDHLVRAWHKTFGLPVVVSHCSNNFGPFQLPDKFIPKLITSAVRGNSIPIYGRGEQRRDWIYVRDHAKALIAVLTQGQSGRSYNVGAENEFSNIVLAHRICAILDRLRPSFKPHAKLLRFVEDRLGHDFRYAIDPERICKELNWRPRFTMEEALESTVRWYLDNQNWWRPLVQEKRDELLPAE